MRGILGNGLQCRDSEQEAGWCNHARNIQDFGPTGR